MFIFSILAGLLFLIGLDVHIALTARYVLTERSHGRKVPTSTLAWNALYGALLLALTLMGFARLIDGGPFALIAPIPVCAAVIACSHVTLRRDQIFVRLHDLEPRLRHRAEWGLLLLYGIITIFMLEWPYSWAIGLYGPTYWWLEMALTMSLAMFFYLVFGRRGSAMLPTAVAYSFIGIAQYFIRKFKNAAILPNDLLVLGTAMAVSDQYTYSLDPRAVIDVVVISAGLCVLSLLHPRWSVQKSDLARSHWLRDRGVGLVSAALCAALVFVPNYMDIFQVQIMYWYSINFYEKQGFLPTFIAVWQDLPIHKPKGYETEDAERALAELSKAYDEGQGASTARQEAEKQFDELKPTVLVVMNESFSDLSEFDQLHCGYEGPQFFKNLSDVLWRGKLYVSVHGGGTCNSEFEFLTGNSLGYIGAGKYPYSMFHLDPIDNLARQLGNEGYGTIAIHPNYASNWSRNKVYADMGFDSFLDIDDFGGFPERNIDGTKKDTTPTGVPVFHSGVSDQATYERVLELLKSDDAPQFIFDVTMQNHGSYNQNNIPLDKLTHYYPTGVYENPAFAETPERLNEFISCIEESDRALEWLVEELRKIDRPVVLVFFGDHQPSMTPDYNDVWFPNEDDLTHSQRVYHANYLVWANYDIAGQENVQGEERDMSVDVLGTHLMDVIGAPLSTYQKAQLAVSEKIQATNLHGYLGENGTWYTEDDDSPYQDLYYQMSLVEYLNFAEKL